MTAWAAIAYGTALALIGTAVLLLALLVLRQARTITVLKANQRVLIDIVEKLTIQPKARR